MDLIEKIVTHGTIGWIPVSEANSVVFGVSTEVDDDAHQEEPDKRNDLETAEPELKLAEYADTEQVDQEDYNHGQRNCQNPRWSGDLLKVIKITNDVRLLSHLSD